jgi:hypothetical protein
MPINDSFAGEWITSFGPMTIALGGAQISGVYRYGEVEGHLDGELHGDTLTFRYREPREAGSGEFRLLRAGRFTGTYTVDGSTRTRIWDGERGWDGVWATDFGRVRLVHEADGVRGHYEGEDGPASLAGRDVDGRLEFRFREPRALGDGRFVLSDDRHTFSGEWCPEGSTEWRPWHGARVRAEPGVNWLLVLEAHWQRSIAENEYAFGHMLREVFARLPGVRVRQRFFNDAASLEHWCRELLYIAEPTILLIASHGVAEGLKVHSGVIDTTHVVQSVRDAGNLKLLHFSSCLVGLDGHATLDKQPFPISGYSTIVDWNASALLEFTYLDLMLNRGLDPLVAAAALPRLVTYARDAVAGDSPYPAAGFRFFPAMNRSNQ